MTEAGEVSARYEYGPFGEEITRRGVGAQPYRFSTKCHNEETGLLYYGHYAPRWGRWLSKDPIGERGGVNLYGMVGNDPLNYIDCLGLARRTCQCDTKAVNSKGQEMSQKAVQMTLADMNQLPPWADRKTSTGREYGGRICCNVKTGSVNATGPIPGPWKRVGLTRVGEGVDPKEAAACSTLGDGWQDAGYYHSHPSGSTQFSVDDVIWMNSQGGGWPLFLGTTGGDTFRMDPTKTTVSTQYGPVPNMGWGDVNQIGTGGGETPVQFPYR